MGMVKKGTVTAKAPSIGTVQVDNGDWVKVNKDEMVALKLGDTLEKETKDRSVAEAAPVKEAKPVSKTTQPVEQSVWDKKDRSQLVGGRSHDSVELVKASLANATPMPKVLELYKEALIGILKISDEIK